MQERIEILWMGLIPSMLAFLFSCGNPNENKNAESWNLTEPPSDFQIDWTSETPIIVPNNVFEWQPRDRGVVVRTFYESVATFDYFQRRAWSAAQERRGLYIEPFNYRLPYRPAVRTLVALDLFEDEPLEFFECRTSESNIYSGYSVAMWNQSDESTFYCNKAISIIEINVDAKTMPSDFDESNTLDEYINVTSEKWKNLGRECLDDGCLRKFWIWTPSQDTVEIIEVLMTLIPPHIDHSLQPRIIWRLP